MKLTKKENIANKLKQIISSCQKKNTPKRKGYYCPSIFVLKKQMIREREKNLVMICYSR